MEYNKDRMRLDMCNRAWTRKVEWVFRDEIPPLLDMGFWEVDEFWEEELKDE